MKLQIFIFLQGIEEKFLFEFADYNHSSCYSERIFLALFFSHKSLVRNFAVEKFWLDESDMQAISRQAVAIQYVVGTHWLDDHAVQENTKQVVAQARRTHILDWRAKEPLHVTNNTNASDLSLDWMRADCGHRRGKTLTHSCILQRKNLNFMNSLHKQYKDKQSGPRSEASRLRTSKLLSNYSTASDTTVLSESKTRGLH